MEADHIFLAAVIALEHTPLDSPYNATFKTLAEKYDFEKRDFAKRRAFDDETGQCLKCDQLSAACECKS